MWIKVRMLLSMFSLHFVPKENLCGITDAGFIVLIGCIPFLSPVNSVKALRTLALATSRKTCPLASSFLIYHCLEWKDIALLSIASMLILNKWVVANLANMYCKFYLLCSNFATKSYPVVIQFLTSLVLSLLRRLSASQHDTTRICCWAPAAAARRPQLSIDICCRCRRAAANLLAAVAAVNRWDRLTADGRINPVRHTLQAASITRCDSSALTPLVWGHEVRLQKIGCRSITGSLTKSHEPGKWLFKCCVDCCWGFCLHDNLCKLNCRHGPCISINVTYTWLTEFF